MMFCKPLAPLQSRDPSAILMVTSLPSRSAVMDDSGHQSYLPGPSLLTGQMVL